MSDAVTTGTVSETLEVKSAKVRKPKIVADLVVGNWGESGNFVLAEIQPDHPVTDEAKMVKWVRATFAAQAPVAFDLVRRIKGKVILNKVEKVQASRG
jgi:hypothetical protein